MKIQKLTILSAVVMSVFAAPAFAAVGDTATYEFNLPSTAVASQTPPYPLVASLTLIEVFGGVDFVLTPNWGGSSGFSASSHIERLDYVYQGPASPTITWLSGAPIGGSSYETNQNNLDSGYKTDDEYIIIDFYTANDANRFDNDYLFSSWNVTGAGLTDFTGTQATSDPKPSPIFGVISVTGYSLDGIQPTPSNWVTSPVSAVPEPETYAMLLAGLGLLGFMAHRRKESAV